MAAVEIKFETDKIIGPIFPWEFPEDFDIFFHRHACGYWQAWGFGPDDREMVVIDVMIDRAMWE